jgi:hypothetical protein
MHRAIEERLLQPYRTDTEKKNELLRRVKQKEVAAKVGTKAAQLELVRHACSSTDQRCHVTSCVCMQASRASAKVSTSSTAEERQAEAARRRTEMAENQRQAITEIVEAKAARSSVKLAAPVK